MVFSEFVQMLHKYVTSENGQQEAVSALFILFMSDPEKEDDIEKDKKHGLGGSLGYSATIEEKKCLCEYCGKDVKQLPGRKLKRFCSDKCRMAWWNQHQENVNRKANYDYVCAYCGKAFTAYGNANRKYCSHECYIEDRFGGAR